jgi:hypothetical protein
MADLAMVKGFGRYIQKNGLKNVTFLNPLYYFANR